VQIAHRVGESGKVYANDIDAAALRYLEQRCAKWGFGNVEAIVGEPTHPRFPEGELDLIFMISTYHHISQPTELMRNALPALKPDGRLAIAEWVPRNGNGATNSATPPEVLEKRMNEAGYELQRTVPFPDPTNGFNIYIFGARRNEVNDLPEFGNKVNIVSPGTATGGPR
jgi:SAM-dependent methyltransferase